MSVKRARGRPQVRSDDETRRLIADAARLEFKTKGYVGTSMDGVARSAGLSKRTVYRLVPTKADLFADLVEDRISRFALSVDIEAIAKLDVEAGIEELAFELGCMTLSEGTIAMQKIAIMESDRFPDLAAAFHAKALAATQKILVDHLRRQCELGRLALEDPELAAVMLRGMMVMDHQRAAMMGLRAPPGIDEIRARARSCARLFVDGCRAHDRRPGARMRRAAAKTKD